MKRMPLESVGLRLEGLLCQLCGERVAIGRLTDGEYACEWCWHSNPDEQMLPGMFLDARTGKVFSISQAYEGCKYDNVQVYTTFGDQAVHWGLWAAVKARIPGRRAYERLRVERWKMQAGAGEFRRAWEKNKDWPQPERFLDSLSRGINYWRHYWD